MNYYFLLICIVFTLAVSVIAKIELDGDVLVLTDDNFAEALATYDSILIEFYAPWCGHCKSLAPEWAKAATALKSVSTKLAKLDAVDNRKSAEEHGIKGFPSIKYFRGGQYASDYSGGRKESDIVAWAQKKSAPAITTITSLSDLETFENANTVFAIGLFSSLESDNAKLFAKVANQDERINYAYSDSSEVKNKYGSSKDSVVIIKDFDEKRSDIEVGDDFEVVRSSIIGYSTPLIQEFSAETSKGIFGSPITKHALFFTKKTADHHKTTLDALTEVAGPNRGRILFVNVPFTETRIVDFFGISEQALPALVLADMSTQSMKKYFYPGDITSSSDVSAYVESFFSGSLKPSLKSEDVEPEDTQGPVTILKGFSFNELVIDNTKDVFVEMYAPWCGHCKKLAPIWDELGQKYESNSNVVIAKMDSTANEVDVPGLDVKGFPSIFFFKGNDKAHPVKYEGGRTLDELASYLDANLHNTVTHEEL